jgi:sugar lactone lactonase YvrE
LAYPTNTATPPTAPVEINSGLSEPDALAVDRLGNLYVVEFGGNDVKVFHPGSLTASKTLAAPGLGPT